MHGSRPKASPRTFSRSGKRGTAHHRGLVSLRISDGKFVNHTTEMILWSMILTLHHQSCPYDKPGIRQQIGEQKLGTIRQNGVSCLLCLRLLLIAAHFLITLASSKIVLGRNSAPSIGRWASFSSPRAHHLGLLFPFLLISFNGIAQQMDHVGCWRWNKTRDMLMMLVKVFTWISLFN